MWYNVVYNNRYGQLMMVIAMRKEQNASTETIKFRLSGDLKERAESISDYCYHGNISKLMIDACTALVEKLEEQRRLELNDALRLSDDEASVIAKELERPYQMNRAFIDFITTDHVDHDELEKRLNAVKIRKTKQKKA